MHSLYANNPNRVSAYLSQSFEFTVRSIRQGCLFALQFPIKMVMVIVLRSRAVGSIES